MDGPEMLATLTTLFFMMIITGIQLARPMLARMKCRAKGRFANQDLGRWNGISVENFVQETMG